MRNGDLLLASASRAFKRSRACFLASAFDVRLRLEFQESGLFFVPLLQVEYGTLEDLARLFADRGFLKSLDGALKRINRHVPVRTGFQDGKDNDASDVAEVGVSFKGCVLDVVQCHFHFVAPVGGVGGGES